MGERKEPAAKGSTAEREAMRRLLGVGVAGWYADNGGRGGSTISGPHPDVAAACAAAEELGDE